MQVWYIIQFEALSWIPWSFIMTHSSPIILQLFAWAPIARFITLTFPIFARSVIFLDLPTCDQPKPVSSNNALTWIVDAATERPCNNSVAYFGCSVSEPFSGVSEPQKLATTIVTMVGMFPHCGVYVLVNILQPPRQTPDCWEHSSVPELPISSGCFLVPHSVSPYSRISWTGSWALRMSTTFCDPSGFKSSGAWESELSLEHKANFPLFYSEVSAGVATYSVSESSPPPRSPHCDLSL